MSKDDLVTVFEFGSGFILSQVEQLEAEFDGALIGDDIEYVHRMRVASRRLRSALGLFNNYFPENHAAKWRREMKGITRALGKARDLDIQILLVKERCQGENDERYKPGYGCLLLRLTQQRSKVQQKVVSAINTLKESQTLEEMKNLLKRVSLEEIHQYTPALVSIAKKAINNALDTFLTYEEFIQTSDNGKKLHAMRIAGKHLRYTMEIFSPLYQDGINPFIEIMKEIQDQLGEIHDCDVWIAWLPDFFEQKQVFDLTYFGHSQSSGNLTPGIAHLIEDRKQKRRSEYQAFLANWLRLNREQTWENLREITQTQVTS